MKETDITCDDSDEQLWIDQELVVIAVPVYAGRVAPLAVKRLQRFKSNGSPVILAVLYGNRDYEDALLELHDIALQQGFRPLSAAAFIGEHSYSRKEMPIAEGRPTANDLQLAERFGKESLGKLQKMNAINELLSLKLKGNTPYKVVATPTPAAPITVEERCTSCLACLHVCPTNAIRLTERELIFADPEKCIKCCACVKRCPVGALIFDTPYTAMLHAKCSVERVPEFFF